MSMLSGLARLARARAQRRTEQILDTLPPEIQKDIGWRWSPSRRDTPTPRLPDWNL